MAMAACPVVGLVLFGTSATLLAKTLMSTDAVIAGTRFTFAKPGFVTWLVCSAYLSTLPMAARNGLSLSIKGLLRAY